MSSKRIINSFSAMRNALMSKHDYVNILSNSVVASVCGILKEQGYIKGFEPLKESGNRNVMKVRLKYLDKQKKVPAIMNLKLISKPSRKVYTKYNKIKPTMNGLGIGIISTSKGVMTTDEAKKNNIGGEMICEVF